MTCPHARNAPVPFGSSAVPLTKRALLAGLMASSWIEGAWPACRDKVLTESEAALVSAAAGRLKTLGVTRVMPVGTVAGKNYYRLDGSKVRLFFVPDKGPVTAVGVILSQPAPQADADLQTTLAAFILSRISGVPEASIQAKLAKSFSARASEDKWVETFADTTALVTRSPTITVILNGRIDCS